MANIASAVRANLAEHRARRAEQLEAAEAEYQSWLARLNVERINYCPDGRMHVDDVADLAKTGYDFVCRRCGHHSFVY